MNQATLSIRIDVDNKGGVRVLQQTGTEIKQMAAAGEKEVRKLADSIGGFERRLGGIPWGLMAGGMTAATGMSVAGIVSLAGQVQTSSFQMQKAFGSAGDAMIQKSKELTAAGGNYYGLQEVQYALTKTGDSMARYGITGQSYLDLVGRAMDVGAAKGMDLKDSIDRIESAMRGEAEASEYLGVTLNDTYMKNMAFNGALKDSWEKLSDNEKAMYRYREFMEQSGKYTGAAADATDTMSGSLKALANAIVTDATPALDGLAKSAATAIQTMTALWRGDFLHSSRPADADPLLESLKAQYDNIERLKGSIEGARRGMRNAISWSNKGGDLNYGAARTAKRLMDELRAAEAEAEAISKKIIAANRLKNNGGASPALLGQNATAKELLAARTGDEKEYLKSLEDADAKATELLAETLDKQKSAAEKAASERKRLADAARREELAALDVYAEEMAARYRDVPDDPWMARYASADEKKAKVVESMRAMDAWEKKRVTDQRQAADEGARIYERFYDDLGKHEKGYSNYRRQALDERYQKYKDHLTALADQDEKYRDGLVLLEKWKAAETHEIEIDQARESGNLINGLQAGWARLADAQIKWGDVGFRSVQTFAQSSRATLEDGFLDWFMGDLKSLEDYGNAVWKSLAAGFASMAAQIVTDYAAKGLHGLMSGGGGGLIGGITGLASTAWDVADWLGSDLLGFWDVGAYRLKKDQLMVGHAGEMVVPADMADALRLLIDAGGSGNASLGESWGASPAGEMTATDARALGALWSGTAGGMTRAGLLGLGYYSQGQIGLGDLAAGIGRGGLMGMITGGVPAAIGELTGFSSPQSMIAARIGAAAAGVLGLGPLGALALGLVGLPIGSAIGDYFGLRNFEAVRDALEDTYGWLSGHSRFADLLSTGELGANPFNAGRVSDYASNAGLYGPSGTYGRDDIGGGGGGGGYSYGSGMGHPGEGGSGDAGDFRHGGWSYGPLTGYTVRHHGTEYVLNTDQIRAVRDLGLAGAGSGSAPVYVDVTVEVAGEQFEALIDARAAAAADKVRVEALRRNVGARRIV